MLELYCTAGETAMTEESSYSGRFAVRLLLLSQPVLCVFYISGIQLNWVRLVVGRGRGTKPQ